jgi:hypothetical protein
MRSAQADSSGPTVEMRSAQADSSTPTVAMRSAQADSSTPTVAMTSAQADMTEEAAPNILTLRYLLFRRNYRICLHSELANKGAVGLLETVGRYSGNLTV